MYCKQMPRFLQTWRQSSPSLKIEKLLETRKTDTQKNIPEQAKKNLETAKTFVILLRILN